MIVGGLWFNKRCSQGDLYRVVIRLESSSQRPPKPFRPQRVDDRVGAAVEDRDGVGGHA